MLEMPATKSMLATAPAYADVPAHDIGRARDFYGNTLGLQTSESGMPGPGMFTVQAGADTRFMVYETQAKDEATVLTFLVEDLPAAMNDLKSRGVKFEDYDLPGLKTVNGIADGGGQNGKAAWFKDSEGNTLNIAEM
jgi:predicted enzyme related to lactoylglutathione lyase